MRMRLNRMNPAYIACSIGLHLSISRDVSRVYKMQKCNLTVRLALNDLTSKLPYLLTEFCNLWFDLTLLWQGLRQFAKDTFTSCRHVGCVALIRTRTDSKLAKINSRLLCVEKYSVEKIGFVGYRLPPVTACPRGFPDARGNEAGSSETCLCSKIFVLKNKHFISSNAAYSVSFVNACPKFVVICSQNNQATAGFDRCFFHTNSGAIRPVLGTHS